MQIFWKKISKNIRQEKLYQVFMYNFLCQKDKIFIKISFYGLYVEFYSLSILYIYYSNTHIIATTFLFTSFTFFMFTIVVYQKQIHFCLKSSKFFNCNTASFIFHFSKDQFALIMIVFWQYLQNVEQPETTNNKQKMTWNGPKWCNRKPKTNWAYL